MVSQVLDGAEGPFRTRTDVATEDIDMPLIGMLPQSLGCLEVVLTLGTLVLQAALSKLPLGIPVLALSCQGVVSKQGSSGWQRFNTWGI